MRRILLATATLLTALHALSASHRISSGGGHIGPVEDWEGQPTTATAAGLYSQPTFGQVERCIGAVKEIQGDPSAYTAACARASGLYSYPTFDQVERLISTIRAGTNVFDAVGARYLSIWDCTTGLPLSNRTDVVYRPGDVYVVGSAYAHPVTNALYCHTLEMHGWTQGPNVYTNLVFAFTNAVAAPYVTFDDVVTAANAVASGKKDSFPASGEILDSIESNVVVRALDAHVTPDIQLMLGDGTMSYGTKGTATNATYLVDTVTLVGLSGQLNYKPAGACYVEGVASTNVESETVGPNATYWYDGADWHLLPSGSGEVDLSSRTTFQQATNISEAVVSNDLSKIKINGQSLSPNVTITTYAPFKEEWVNASATNIAAFFAAVAADPDAKAGTAFLGGLKKNSTPTFTAQVEAELKVMKSAKDDSLIYVVTVYSTDQAPYFWFNMYHNSSVSGWRKYLRESDVASWALSGNTAPITNVTINTTTLSVDPATRIASGTIATCGPFPTGWTDNTTTILFCESIVLHMDAANKTGVMYMGTVNFNDAESESPGRAEVIITVVADNRADISPTDPEDFQNEVILKLEATSTNNRMRHWMTIYEKFGKKKDVYDTYKHGKISFGGTRAPWFGMLFKPLDDQTGAWSDTKLTTPKYIAASMDDLGAFIPKSGGSYTGEVKVVSSSTDNNSTLRLRANRIDISASNKTARVQVRNTESENEAALVAIQESASLSLSGPGGGIDIYNTGRISTAAGEEIFLPENKSGTIALTNDFDKLQGQEFDLTDDADLRNAVKKLVQALGGTVTAP